jgi:hypothetical protein
MPGFDGYKVKEPEVELVHKSDVYFDLYESRANNNLNTPKFTQELHHGDVYIYPNQLILHENGRWLRVKVSDIVEVKTLPNHKQLLIQVCWFDLILYCKEESHLTAISNFLNLIINNPAGQNTIRSPAPVGNKILRKIKVKVPAYFSRISN